jgi:hypothetical protein
MFEFFKKPEEKATIELDSVISIFTDAITQLEAFEAQEAATIVDLQAQLDIAVANVDKASRISDKIKNLVD